MPSHLKPVKISTNPLAIAHTHFWVFVSAKRNDCRLWSTQNTITFRNSKHTHTTNAQNNNSNQEAKRNRVLKTSTNLTAANKSKTRPALSIKEFHQAFDKSQANITNLRKQNSRSNTIRTSHPRKRHHAKPNVEAATYEPRESWLEINENAAARARMRTQRPKRKGTYVIGQAGRDGVGGDGAVAGGDDDGVGARVPGGREDGAEYGAGLDFPLLQDALPVGLLVPARRVAAHRRRRLPASPNRRKVDSYVSSCRVLTAVERSEVQALLWRETNSSFSSFSLSISRKKWLILKIFSQK